MSSRPAFLLFSGHNDRAVVALCRFFARQRLQVVIVASGRDDPIFATDHRRHVRFVRGDRHIDVALLRMLGTLGATPLVYVPTTEFINDFVIAHRNALQGCGLVFGLPPGQAYRRLTSKQASLSLFDGLPGVRLPRTLPDDGWCAPCVLKPRANVDGGRVLYPLLCADESALQHARHQADPRHYFAQEWVQGQSVYLCAYLARDGRQTQTWQANLMQQGSGKSIVLARTIPNPGFETQALFERLRSIGYHGPLMVEFIRDGAGLLAYIETNPRFWGPLQLSLDACPALLELFAQDHGDLPAPLSPELPGAHLYAWWHGAQAPGAVLHPAGRALAGQADLPALLRAHDVYAREDTRALHGRH